jgi:OmpA-OmpF porin, OOP family
MNSTIRSTLIGLAAAGALLPALAAAEAMDGYLTDKGGAVVKAPRAGVCVRTRQWTPALAIAECDPDLVKKPMAAPRAEPMRPAPKKAAKKKKKAKPMNVQYKIELQGMPFDKAQMTADNKKEADKFLAGLGKANKRAKRGPVTIGAVVVTGHTDRLGAAAYNQKLSERRAVVVKDYLISKGVDQKLIFWEGKGPKNPIPVTKFCDNKMKRKQLIECLAPNRRVTVEVVGRAPRLAKPKK